MLGPVVALALAAGSAPPAVAPMTLVVSTSRGETRVAVRSDPELGPVVPAPLLIPALGGQLAVDGAWAEVEVARQPFRLLLGAPVYAIGKLVKPLVGSAIVRRDTLLLPLAFVTEVIPGELKERYRYDPEAGRLVEVGGRAAGPAVLAAAKDPARLPNGLRKGHVVTIDPGHGGVDPGNPGLFFPRGVTESAVTLEVGLLVRQELLKRGIGVIMTRTTDTLIDLGHRGSYCSGRCDLFVSIHVNSLPRRAGYTGVRGFETYFLAEAKTEDAARVARMENEAVRFDASPQELQPEGGLDFILKDLQLNEHLRESGRLAELIQSHMSEVHTGPDRGVKQGGLMVLTTARRPAVLVELGYATNRQDAALMSSRRSQRNLAASIADGIVAYLLEYEQRAGLAAPEVDARASSGTGSEPR